MLPTKGYFQDIDCPYYDNQCGRPYCHFRHKRKQQDSGNDSPKDSEVPTYKPTPKSQLANNRSHIPISYVPDLAFRPERRNIQKVSFEKPTYKPTPLSVLSSANNQHAETCDKPDRGETTSEVAHDNTSVEYSPLDENTNTSYEYTPSNKNIQPKEGSANEYKPVGEGGSHLEYNPTSSSDETFVDKSDTHYSPTGEGQSNIEYHPSHQNTTAYDSSTIDFEDFSNEFDMIDEIISDGSVNTEKEQLVDNIECKLSEQKTACAVKSSKNISKSDSDNDNSDFKTDQNKTSKSKSSRHLKPECIGKKTKHSGKNLQKERPSSKSDHSSRHKTSNSSKKDDSNKNKEKIENNIHKEDQSKEKDSSLKSKRKSNEKNEVKEKKHNSNKEKDEHKKSDGNKEKQKKKKHDEEDIKEKEKKKCDGGNKGKEKKKCYDKEKEMKKCEDKDKEKEKKRKGDDKEKERKHETSKAKKSHKDKYKDKERKRDRDKSKEIKEGNLRNESTVEKDRHESKTLKTLRDNEERSSSKDNSPTLDDFDNADLDFDLEDDDDETLRECYRIFNEYKPQQTDSRLQSSIANCKKTTEIPDAESFVGKKRVAHTNAEKITPKIQLAPTNSLPSAAQAMTNRFRIARLAQASNEQNNLMSEMKHVAVKRPAPSLMAAVRNYKMQKTMKDTQITRKPVGIPSASSTSLVDNIINSSHKTNHAVAKFAQRKIAPVANVLSFQRAKERIDEIKQKTADTLKKTTAQTLKGAKRVAHVPEFSLSDIPDVINADKSKLPVNVRTRFLTMIAEECGKLFLTKEDAYTRALNEEFSCYEKCKVLITYKNSAMLAVSRLRKELLEREKQGLGPIYAGEESSKDKSSQFKGKKFYDNIERYVLTNEELDIHGYPKESETPGKVVIKNKKPSTLMPLEEFQRKCSRCSKIYVVDEDGFAFYEEECLYHPLKKRTLRGEQTYLCCKSNDDTGCVASHTHVSEVSVEADLEGYQTTMEPERDDDPRNFAVYALDCEMCYTTKGLELTRVTIVDSECKTVYDTLVKPLNPIIDYNTRFSGITKDQMDRTSTSILQVQANILHLCNSRTILIGHSLESDMKALKIVHTHIIDTSVLFPHRLGLPHKRALRALASEYLEKIIQNDISGHDSSEDAITCMELIKWKLKEELKVRGIK